MYQLNPETDADHWEIEALYDTCFAPGREALSSYRLRDGVPAVAGLSHVARDADGILGGAIRYWPVRLLIEESLKYAAPMRWNRVMLVGDAPYYGKFGFERLSGVHMPPPTNPERVLGRALVPGAWGGVSGDVRRWID